MTKLTTATVLAFERKLDTSDALLFSGNWEERNNYKEWQKIPLRVKSVRGTISNRLKTKDQDPTKLDAKIESPNLQEVDVATLDSQHDTLQMRFTLRVLPDAGTPSACNNTAYQQKLLETVNLYKQEYGFQELGKRYAYNLANGRFLWRNRIGAESISVQVNRLVDGEAVESFVFDGFDFSLRNFEQNAEKVADLGHLISKALMGEEPVLLEVIAFSRMGCGQEVFPSQELIMERGKGDKSRTLYDVNGIAALHSQKVGNAIRTIDTWYPSEGDEQDLGPIAIEVYGAVTTQGKAYRQPKQKMDFYNLLDNWLLKDEKPVREQQHYVMAVLVRGGVFGDGGKD